MYFFRGCSKTSQSFYGPICAFQNTLSIKLRQRDDQNTQKEKREIGGLKNLVLIKVEDLCSLPGVRDQVRRCQYQ